MWLLPLQCFAAYLLGSVMGALLVSRLLKTDLRRYGSGNPGATNAFRVLGPRWGSVVLVIDIGKGLAAILLVAPLSWADGELAFGSPWPSLAWVELFCALAVLAGHAKPIFFSFRGGKGVATAAGALLAMVPFALLLLLPAWLIIATGTGFVSLASTSAAALLPIAIIISSPTEALLPYLLFAAAVTGFILYAHRDNLERLRRGREHRLDKIMLRTWIAKHRNQQKD